MKKKTLLEILDHVPDDVEITFDWFPISSATFDRPTNILIFSNQDVSLPVRNEWALSGAPVIYTQGRIVVDKIQPRAEFDSDFHSTKGRIL
jgi:hypothetical protein